MMNLLTIHMFFVWLSLLYLLYLFSFVLVYMQVNNK